MSGRHVRKGRHIADDKYPTHPAERDYSLAIGALVTAVIVLFLTAVAVSAFLIKAVPVSHIAIGLTS
jgi:hypothetical protein